MRFKGLLIVMVLSLLSCEVKVKSENSDQKNEVINEKKKSNGELLFDDGLVHEIRVTFPQKFWKDSLRANKAYKDSVYESKYLQCNAEVDGNKYYACGIRFKGESSYQFYPSDKKSFRLKFNSFIKSQKHDGIKGISLNNNFKDPSMMREKLVLDYCRDNGVVSQRSVFAKLFINNQYWGVYTVLDNVNSSFMKRKFGTKKGHFIQGKPRAYFMDLGNDTLAYKRSYTYKTMDQSVPEIMKLCKAISGDENLSKYLNLKSMYRQFVVSNFFMNIDAYNMHFPHNFYLFKPKGKEQFEWVNYDYNYSFGAWSPDLTLKDMIELSPYFVRKEGDFPLWEKVLSNPEMKQAYTAEYIKMLEEFDMAAFKLQVRKYQQMLSGPVEEDTLKMYTTEQFLSNSNDHLGDINDPGAFSPGLVEFIKKRKEFLLNFFKDEQAVN